MTKLILASSSPRRRELLARAGYDFEVATAEVAERVSRHLSLRELATANATRKALAVARRTRSRALFLAADTLVSFHGKIIGKPANTNEARAILRRLSGRVHEVCTAVFIIDSRGWFISFAEISRVTFQRLTDEAIEDYIRQVNPLDKAGGYGAQDDAGQIINSIEGSVTNVIGLPMERTTAALRYFGICHSGASTALPVPPSPPGSRPKRSRARGVTPGKGTRR
jgi:septum formation protein